MKEIVGTQQMVTRAAWARIAAKAYELFVHRGCQHGHDVEDWLAAEAAVSAEVPSGSNPGSTRGERPRSGNS